MRKMLSRVEDVYYIDQRGCVVLPGIPPSSDARVKIGDRLWLSRPDGTELTTVVRGIEMGGHQPNSAIPILLGDELTRDDIPPGTLLSIDFTPSATLVIDATADSGPIELERLFSANGDGQLRFGWAARSRQRGLIPSDVLSADVEFVDYIMEGFVAYHLAASISDQALTLTISLHGTNRDEYIEPQICHYLRNAGLTVTSHERRTNG